MCVQGGAGGGTMTDGAMFSAMSPLTACAGVGAASVSTNNAHAPGTAGTAATSATSATSAASAAAGTAHHAHHPSSIPRPNAGRAARNAPEEPHIGKYRLIKACYTHFLPTRD